MPAPQTNSGPSPTRVPFLGGQWFLVGYNYPWHSYQDDFASGSRNIRAQRAVIASQFADMASNGTHVVRWFMFNDFSQNPLFDGHGTVEGISPDVYQSLDDALAIARSNHIYLILDFIDGPQLLKKDDPSAPLHRQIFTDPAVRQSFFDNAVKPVLQRYGQDPNILAWSPINEPDYETMDVDLDANHVGIPYNDMRAFMQEFTQYVHTYTHQLATIENGPLHFVHFWTGLDFDFYSPHYYDWMSSSWPDSNPIQVPVASLHLDKPVVMGELPSAGSKFSVSQFLEALYKNGYAGALFWSQNSNDEFSNYAGSRAVVKQWSTAHEADVNIQP